MILRFFWIFLSMLRHFVCFEMILDIHNTDESRICIFFITARGPISAGRAMICQSVLFIFFRSGARSVTSHRARSFFFLHFHRFNQWAESKWRFQPSVEHSQAALDNPILISVKYQNLRSDACTAHKERVMEMFANFCAIVSDVTNQENLIR